MNILAAVLVILVAAALVILCIAAAAIEMLRSISP